jgi:hypothetical protein
MVANRKWFIQGRIGYFRVLRKRRRRRSNGFLHCV